MAWYLIILSLATLALIATLAALVRYLGTDPGFGIRTRAAGDLSLWTALPFRAVDVIYGDIDSLGKINDALTIGQTLGHDRFNQCMRATLAQIRGADKALVYGGDELRIISPARRIVGRRRHHADCDAQASRLQQLLRDYPWTDAERARLLTATGRDHITITLAFAVDVPYRYRARALAAAKATVGAAKPKCSMGRRGCRLLALE